MDYSFKDDPESISFVINSLTLNIHLTEWEKDFIKSIQFYFDTGGSLSKKQLHKLSSLWEKY